MSKFIDTFKKVDPFIKYIPEERSYDLLWLHFKISILSVLGFLAYTAFSIYVFIQTPEPSELSVDTIYSNMTSEPLFQIVISSLNKKNGQLYTFLCSINDPNNIPQYYLPTRKIINVNSMTKNIKQNEYTYTETGNSFTNINDYIVYQFPVYGTSDAKYETSYIVLFDFCYPPVTKSPPEIYLGIGNNPSILYNSENIVTDNEPSLTTNIITQIFTNVQPQMINMEVILKKTVYSNKKILYEASFNGPPRFIPSPFGGDGGQVTDSIIQKLLVSINPTVSVLTYKQKNYFTLIGSIAGIFPLFILIGNILSEKINEYKNRNKEKEINMEKIPVL